MKYLRSAVLCLSIIGMVYLGLSGKYAEWRTSLELKAGDKKMKKRDFLAALGYYEKTLGRDSIHVEAHLRAAAALDSMKRPVEAGWHYDAAKK